MSRVTQPSDKYKRKRGKRHPAARARGSIAFPTEMAPVTRVVIMVQENHTTDNYFRGLAPYGAAVATDWPIGANPPASDNPHDRKAYFEWLTGALTGAHVQFDTAAALPY